MEFKEYFKIIKQNIGLVILTAVIFVVGGVIYYFYETRQFKGEAIFSVVKIAENKNIDYSVDYDGYYLVESQRNFGRRIGNFLIERSKIKDYYNDFGVFEFSAKQLSDFDYKVVLKGKDAGNIDEFFGVLSDDLIGYISSLSSAANEKIIFSSLAHSKKIEKNKINFNFLSFFGFLIFSGLVFGIILSFFKHYLKSS